MPNRRNFIIATAVNLFAVPRVGRAQRPTKQSRVGILLPNAAGPNVAAFEKGLRDHGWVEGENLFIERRNAEGHSERYHDLARDLVRQKVDVILPAGGPLVAEGRKRRD